MTEPSGQHRGRVKRTVSAFASARVSFNITAEIGVKDVQALRPSWTETRCQQFLRENGDAIGHEMVLAGAMAPNRTAPFCRACETTRSIDWPGTNPRMKVLPPATLESLE